jgi:hypothetical protein
MMRYSWPALIALVLLPFATLPAHAAKIYVEATTPDRLGRQIVYSLRNHIAASALHEIALSENEAGFVISIVTLDSGEDGNQSVYSAVLTIPPVDGQGFNWYVTNVVGICGANRVEACASYIMADFDARMAEITRVLSDTLREYPAGE